MGLVNDVRWERFCARRDRFERNLAAVNETMVRVPSGARVSAAAALRQPEIRLSDLVEQGDVRLALDPRDRELDVVSVETNAKYEGYLRRQTQVVERNRRREHQPIPCDFPFERVPGLSRELVQRFTQVRPESLGQALRIPGATPAAVAVVAAYLRNWSGSHAPVAEA